MKGQDIIYFMFILILGYLVLTNWKGAQVLLTSAFGGVIGTTKVLQGR